MKVDCSLNPAAILTVRTNSRTLRLRTDNYKSLLLVGADAFSCDWTDRAVVANYKAGGKADGDFGVSRSSVASEDSSPIRNPPRGS